MTKETIKKAKIYAWLGKNEKNKRKKLKNKQISSHWGLGFDGFSAAHLWKVLYFAKSVVQLIELGARNDEEHWI